jgi:endonuclease/exonuclease/phosphatase family metal-dependent hydrolase
MSLKVVSWNILGGKYLDAVIAQLKEIDADIIGLQEIKEFIKGDHRENIAQTIAQSLGYHFVFCESFIDDRHERNYSLGNAILTKLPIDSSNCLSLSGVNQYQYDAMTEPRSACICNFKIKGKNLKVINTHLGFSRESTLTSIRKEQLHNLVELVDQDHVVLMGDLNSIPESEIVKTLNNLMINTDSDLTKTTKIDDDVPGNPKVRIDYIFVTKNLSHQNFQILPTEASDHNPIQVELDLD